MRTLTTLYRSKRLGFMRPCVKVLTEWADFVSSMRGTRAILESKAWPPHWLTSLRAARILIDEYGHLQSVAKRLPVDRFNAPLPWYTYPAIEYLAQLDFSDKSIFEYGSGTSTLFWSSRAARVVSVEDDEAWHARLTGQLEGSPHTRVILTPDLEEFPKAISRVHGSFDVIVIDGPGRGLTRLKCCKAGRGRLNRGGLMILDNSEYLPQSAAFLRSTGLLEVDMTGFAPMNAHTSTTSLFFDREFSFATRAAVQPVHGVGGLSFDWETPRVLPGRRVVIGDDVYAGVEHEAQFTIHSGDRTHKYRLFLYHINETHTAFAIVDEDADRIVVDGHAIANRGGWWEPAEVEWLKDMTFDRFRHFVNSHPRRRYTV